jgi:hypothetical protein
MGYVPYYCASISFYYPGRTGTGIPNQIVRNNNIILLLLLLLENTEYRTYGSTLRTNK